MPKNIAADITTIIPLGIILNSYDKIIPEIIEPREKHIESKIVLLNPYPINKDDTFGIINREETIRTPINRIEITMTIVVKTINK